MKNLENTMATLHTWNCPRSHLYCLYSGVSMFPTLREPDILEIIPYHDRPVRVGDVILFRPPTSDKHLIVHRIIDITPQGIRTQGDNTHFSDPWLISPERILGQIIIAWRGQRARTISGGWKGRIMRTFIQQGRYICHVSIRHFRLIPWGKQLVRRLIVLLSKFWSPRVILFHTNGSYYARLLLGKRIIGWYSSQQKIWHISYPFYFFVNPKNLPDFSIKSLV